jgi:F420-non-reducing hydrogenase iron-sulfur subunit
MATAEFEPKILAFCCNWCSYAGADLAGVSRMQYPPNVRIIRVMCSGRVSPELVVKALRSGADGVVVLGCHIGDCHYISGNHRTKKRMAILRGLLSYMGVDPRRVRLEWVSASEGDRFAQVVTEVTREIKELGPNRLFTDQGQEKR